MAVTLAHHCPHCETERAGFTLVGESEVPTRTYHWQAFFQCNTCFWPVVMEVYNGTGRSLSSASGDIAQHPSIHNQVYFPKPAPPSAPMHIPEMISRAFIQAEDAIKRQHWEAAGAMDRRALEIATKEIAPEHAKLSLYTRIEKLAEASKLTLSLKEWAHGLRLVGNDAVHEIDGIDKKEATQAHELTRFILIYLYTLPAQVKQAQTERANGN